MNVKSLQWVDRYHRYLTMERQLSPHTVSSYGLDIAALVSFCDKAAIDSWQRVEISHAALVCGTLARQGLDVALPRERRLRAAFSFKSGRLPARAAFLYGYVGPAGGRIPACAWACFTA